MNWDNYYWYASRRVVRRLRQAMVTVSWLPLLAGVLLALCFALVGQFRELYVSYADGLLVAPNANGAGGAREVLHAWLAFGAMLLLSAVLHYANRTLGDMHVERLFQSAIVDPGRERSVRAVGLIAVGLPWFGLCYGVIEALITARHHIEIALAGPFAGSTHPMKGAEAFFTRGFASGKLETGHLEKLHTELAWAEQFWWLPWVVLAGIIARSLASVVPWLLVLAWSVSKLSSSIARLRKSSGSTPSGNARNTWAASIRSWWQAWFDALHDLYLRARFKWAPGASRWTSGAVLFITAFLTIGNIFVPLAIESRAGFESGEPSSMWTWARAVFAPYLLSRPSLTPTSWIALIGLSIAVLLGLHEARRRSMKQPDVHWVPTLHRLNLLIVGSFAEAALLCGLWDLWPGWTNTHATLGHARWMPTLVQPMGLWAGAIGALLGMSAFSHWAWLLTKSTLPFSSWRLLAAIGRVSAFTLLVAVVLSGLWEFQWINVSRAIGPLAMAIILGVVLIAIAVSISYVGQETGIPLPLLLVVSVLVIVASKLEWTETSIVIIVVLVVLAVAFAVLAPGRIVGFGFLLCLIAAGGLTARAIRQPTLTSSSAAPVSAGESDRANPEVFKSFVEWQKTRTPSRWAPGNRRYPVFVIAAEGGGIYAAAMSSAFLARMQERCPAFAQHVFAISAVSGGAVGSLVFHSAVDMKTDGLVEDGCRAVGWARTDDQAGTSLPRKVAAVIQDDHLSPLIGLVVPDLLGTIDDRADGLRYSLDDSLARHLDPGGQWAHRRRWHTAFGGHWTHIKPAPALIFNTTWVRVGNRVIFAPFRLDPDRFVTLNTFDALSRDKHWTAATSDSQSLLHAAVTSARFPGVLPAFEARTDLGPDRSREDRRWSFVDGGYVDASGALTAQEVFESLASGIEAHKNSVGVDLGVDLRLILLTSTQSRREELGSSGAEMRDAAAPILTLFSVRSLLSRIAVRETIAKIDSGRQVDRLARLGHDSQLGAPGGWKVTVVELNQDAFKLELGWKISPLTYSLVSLQLGSPELCANADATARQPRAIASAANANPTDPTERKKFAAIDAARTVRANSCVMAALEKLLAR